MATNTRPELSDKNQWWINKHRYYELKHFCLQYPDWRKTYNEFDGLPSVSPGLYERINRGEIVDPTSEKALLLQLIVSKITAVEKAAYEACAHQFWYSFLIDAVTNNKSYDVLEAQTGIMPVSRNEWYIYYRKFFWYLDKIRD